MKKFELPTIEIVKITADVIVTSPQGEEQIGTGGGGGNF